MLVSHFLIPTGLNIPSLATALGEYPRVLLQTCTGHWPMLPRLAQRLDEMGDHLVFKGALTKMSANAWLTHHQCEDVPTKLIPDKVTTKVIPKSFQSRVFTDWYKVNPAFTMEVFMAAYGFHPTQLTQVTELLQKDGMFARRERHKNERIIVWRWNPKKFVMPNGRAPLNMPTKMSPPPGMPVEIIERPTKIIVSFDQINNFYMKEVNEFLTNLNQEAFILDSLTHHLKLKFNCPFGQTRTIQALKFLLRELGWEFSRKKHRWEMVKEDF